MIAKQNLGTIYKSRIQRFFEIPDGRPLVLASNKTFAAKKVVVLVNGS